MSAKFVAMIPARGGSKTIPYKNIKMLNGKPLIYYTINAALNCSLIDDVFVSTEDDKVTKVAEECGAKVINRPSEFATDEADTECVLNHFVKNVDADYYCLMQATSPFTISRELEMGCSVMTDNPDYDSLVTFTTLDKFIWKIGFENDECKKFGGFDLKPVNYHYHDRPRRQDFGDLQRSFLVETGSFFIAKKDIAWKCRMGGKIYPLIVNDKHKLELDSLIDWKIAEEILKNEV